MASAWRLDRSIDRKAGRLRIIFASPERLPGTYESVGVGGALVGGAGSVQLRNEKGVFIRLHGVRVGLEFAANLSGIRIAFG